MQKLILSSVTLGLAAQLATAQIKLPSPSPGATVMQTVGTSEFTVKYSRPTLKGRTPFTDAFLPTGKIWRTGANQATAFTTSTDVMVNGKNLPAGTYAILSMPSMDDWTLIFSKNMTVTEPTYKEADDVLRVSLKPEMLPQSVEAFTINFGDLTDSTATLNFMFGKVNAKANLMVNTSQYAGANVDKAAAEKPDDPAVLQAAASYNLSKGRNLDQALEWINKSVATKETFRNLYVKSQILAKMGKASEALPVAKQAFSLGQSSNDATFPFFKDGIEKSIMEYTAMMPAMPTKKKSKK